MNDHGPRIKALILAAVTWSGLHAAVDATAQSEVDATRAVERTVTGKLVTLK